MRIACLTLTVALAASGARAGLWSEEVRLALSYGVAEDYFG